MPVFLFFLNQGNQNVFKELTQPKQSEEPEILKPQDKAEKRPATDNSSTQADEEKAKAEKEAAEKAKIELSGVASTNINLPFITADATGPKHLDVTLTRAKFEELTADLVQATIEPTRKSYARCWSFRF